MRDDIVQIMHNLVHDGRRLLQFVAVTIGTDYAQKNATSNAPADSSLFVNMDGIRNHQRVNVNDLVVLLVFEQHHADACHGRIG